MMTNKKAQGSDKKSPLALNTETVKDLSGEARRGAVGGHNNYQKQCSHTTGPATDTVLPK